MQCKAPNKQPDNLSAHAPGFPTHLYPARAPRQESHVLLAAEEVLVSDDNPRAWAKTPQQNQARPRRFNFLILKFTREAHKHS